MPARLSIARWRSASPSGCSLYRASSNRDVRVSDASRETWSRSTARTSSSLGVRASWAVIPRAPSSAQNRRKHARITDRTSPPTSSSSIASCTASAAACRAAGSSSRGSASISTMPAPRRSRTTKMTIVTRTVNPRNRPSGAPAATGHPDPLAAPASPVVGAVWPTRNAWSIRGQASSRAMIRIRPIAEEMTCHHENGFVGARRRTRRRRNAWTRIATTKLTKTTRNRSPRSGSKTPNALGSVPPEAPAPGIASPPVSRFATLKASAATSRIARNRRSGTAHSAFPRHVRITSVRRRRALITVSRTPTGVGGSRDAELLEELLPPFLADEPQGESDQSGNDGERECEDRKSKASAERARGRRGRGRGGVHRRAPQTSRASRNHQERPDCGEGHRETEHERDRDALGMQDLAALVRELVVDPLASLVDALHEAGGPELLEVLEEGRLAQTEEITQVRDRLPPHIESLQDPHADVRGERLEALLVQGDLRAAAGIHSPASDAAQGT